MVQPSDDGDPSWPAARRAALLALGIAVGYFAFIIILLSRYDWEFVAVGDLVVRHGWPHIPFALIVALLVAFLASRHRIFLALAEPCFVGAYLLAVRAVPYGWIVFLDFLVPGPIAARDDALYASPWRVGLAGLAGYLVAATATQLLVRRAATAADRGATRSDAGRPVLRVRLARWLGRKSSRSWRGLAALAAVAALPFLALLVYLVLLKFLFEPDLDLLGRFVFVVLEVTSADHLWAFLFVDPFVSGWWFSIPYLLMYVALLVVLAVHAGTRSMAALRTANLCIVGMYVLLGAGFAGYDIDGLFAPPPHGYDLRHAILLPLLAAAVVLPIGHYLTRRAAAARR